MLKWILGCLVAAIVLFALVYPRQTVKTSYVNGLTQYNQLPGREYIFEKDCYIFKVADGNTDWPLVGSHMTIPQLPESVDAKNIGTEIAGLRILDTVAVGSRFKIASVRRDQKGNSATITYEILFMDEDLRKYPRLDASRMLDGTEEKPDSVPKFLMDYAVPRRTS